MVKGMLLFAVAAFFISFMTAGSKDLDPGKIAAYVTLIAWASFLYGLYLSSGMY